MARGGARFLPPVRQFHDFTRRHYRPASLSDRARGRAALEAPRFVRRGARILAARLFDDLHRLVHARCRRPAGDDGERQEQRGGRRPRLRQHLQRHGRVVDPQRDEDRGIRRPGGPGHDVRRACMGRLSCVAAESAVERLTVRRSGRTRIDGMRRTAILVGLFIASLAAHAQYPSRPILLVVPYTRRQRRRSRRTQSGPARAALSERAIDGRDEPARRLRRDRHARRPQCRARWLPPAACADRIAGDPAGDRSQDALRRKRFHFSFGAGIEPLRLRGERAMRRMRR